MNILIVVESFFGNTREIAQVISSSLTELGHAVTLQEISDAPLTIADDIDVLVVGAPTHNRGMSTPQSRLKASEGQHSEEEQGVREWLTSLTFAGTPAIAAFDTVTSRSWINGSAAKKIAKVLSAHARGNKIAIKSFIVRSAAGPLAPTQTMEAQSWASSLVQ
ncbi:flavodoxin [Stomatohabitans albus]|uniref:flavodoxin family protein n=1 Tax=Stomatohabitans albus TaxID=3110766 RepID=UPI00300C837B